MPNHVYSRTWRSSLPTASKGSGVWVYDDTGKAYLDAVGGVYAVSIGHGVAEIGDAMAAQARAIAFPWAGKFTTEAEIELADRVIAMSPRGISRAYFVGGGSEANEVAIKFARKYHLVKRRPERWRIIGRWQSYHGATMGALAASGHVSRRSDFDPYLADFPHIPAPHCYACPFGATYPSCGLRCADELELTIRQEGAETIAAFIAEVVTGASSGAIVPPPEYYPRIREICDKYDILFIADEVITGFARTGANFGIDHWGVVPDLITCGKGIGSGYAPLGAVLLHERIMNVFEQSAATSVFTGYTYSGHPVTCAAGVAVLDYIREHDLVKRAETEGTWFLEQLASLERHPTVGQVRGKGFLAGVEFVADKETKAPLAPSTGFVERVVKEAWDRGMVLHAGRGTRDGVLGEHLLLAPPLVANRAELGQIVTILDEAITVAETALSH